MIKNKDNSVNRDILQDRLMKAMGEGFDHGTAHDVRAVCPIEGKASIYGGEVTRLSVFAITEQSEEVAIDFAEIHSENNLNKEDEVTAAMFDEDINEGDNM